MKNDDTIKWNSKKRGCLYMNIRQDVVNAMNEADLATDKELVDIIENQVEEKLNLLGYQNIIKELVKELKDKTKQSTLTDIEVGKKYQLMEIVGIQKSLYNQIGIAEGFVKHPLYDDVVELRIQGGRNKGKLFQVPPHWLKRAE
jgi:hypothetical protein